MQLTTSSPALLKKMAERAHATVVERFEQAAQIEQLESFYEEAIAMNGVTEPVKARPIAQFAPQFAEGLPAE